MDEWWFDELEVEEAGEELWYGGDLVLEEGQVIWWHWGWSPRHGWRWLPGDGMGGQGRPARIGVRGRTSQDRIELIGRYQAACSYYALRCARSAFAQWVLQVRRRATAEVATDVFLRACFG
jgi:hypothetical protein